MSIDEDEVNKELPQREKKREKTKEEILDETFKKAEILKGKVEKKVEEKKIKKTVERPFLKSGIILILIAIIALAFIEYSPWLYIDYETDEGAGEQFFYRGFNEELDFNKINLTILNLFWSPCTNCSDNSQNYIGLTFDDFSNSPQTMSNGFIGIVLMGIIFTVFLIIDKFRKFSDDIILVVHSLFSAGIIVVSLLILISSIKFIGTYFLLYHNWSFIEISGITGVTLVFLVPIILVILTIAIIRGSIMMLKINFREMEKKLKLDNPESPFSTYRYGSNIK
jgi:hypothetical protein